MKKLIGLLSLLSVLTVQYGCESYHQKEGMQEQQEQQATGPLNGTGTIEKGAGGADR